jgi:hypothetical protein
MFDKSKKSMDTEDLLEDLQQQQPQQVRHVGDKAEHALRLPVEVRLAGARHADTEVCSGSTERIGRTSLLGIFPRPSSVGDLYDLNIDQGAKTPVNSVGLCTRCRLLGSRAYEAYFTLYVPLTLGASGGQ